MSYYISLFKDQLQQFTNTLADMFGVPVSQLWLAITFYTVMLFGSLIAVS